MLIIKRENNKYSINCTDPNVKSGIVYSIHNFELPDVVDYVKGRGKYDAEEDIRTIFNYTNLDIVYVTDAGHVHAVNPL